MKLTKTLLLAIALFSMVYANRKLVLVPPYLLLLEEPYLVEFDPHGRAVSNAGSCSVA
jgi:hypothetical protein